MNEKITSIHATVVTYQPDIEVLAPLLAALSPQGAHIVDNTFADDARVTHLCAGLESGNVTLNRSSDNLCVAKALNVDIASAQELGATHIVLSDQDSLSAPDMMNALLAALSRLRLHGRKVGAVGRTSMDAWSATDRCSWRWSTRRVWLLSNAPLQSVGGRRVR